MTSSTEPPEEGVSVQFLFRLSRKGRLDALRQGIQAEEWESYWVTPDDPLWTEVIALEPVQEPVLNDWGNQVGWRNQIIAGRPYSFRTLNEEPTSVEPFGELWQMPEVRAEDAEGLENVQALDCYPSLAGLVQHERDRTLRRDRIAQTLSARLVSRWRTWVWNWAMQLPHVLGEMHAIVSDSQEVTALTQVLAEYTTTADEAERDEKADALLRMFERVSRRESANIARRRRAERAQAEMDDAADWITTHGSIRLRKTLMAGLLESSMKVYRDERLAVDRPGWSWMDSDAAAMLRPVLNPKEEELDALLSARAQFRDVELKFLKLPDSPGETVLVSSFLDRDIYTFVEERF